MEKPALYGQTLQELIQTSEALGFARFTAKQMAEWLYKKNVDSIDGMTNISAANRTKLQEHYQLGLHPPILQTVSADGTKKYLFSVLNDPVKSIEAAFIPDKTRATICVSSQVGCKMKCAFCMTGRQGFQGDLTSTDILNQMRSIPEFNKLTNVVFMGMGEPLDNLTEVMKCMEILTSGWGYAWAPKRVTLSTIGIMPALRTFIEKSNCHLAVSLHTPFDGERVQLVPAQKIHSIHKVLEEIRHHEFGHQRRVSFEYIMLQGVNDTPRHVKELARLLNGMRCRINLIRYHPIPDSPLKGSDEKTIYAFQADLEEKGILTTIRHSRGLDIMAACGMLSTRAKKGASKGSKDLPEKRVVQTAFIPSEKPESLNESLNEKKVVVKKIAKKISPTAQKTGARAEGKTGTRTTVKTAVKAAPGTGTKTADKATPRTGTKTADKATPRTGTKTADKVTPKRPARAAKTPVKTASKTASKTPVKTVSKISAALEAKARRPKRATGKAPKPRTK